MSGILSAQIKQVNITPCGPTQMPGLGCSIPATSAGNLIVVGWQLGGRAGTTNTIKSITDSAGNVYTQVPGARSVDSSGGAIADLWYAKNSTAGATTVTISPTTAVPHGAAVIWEFSGVDTAVPFDQASSLNTQPSSSTPKGASVNTTSASEVIVSLAPDSGNVTGIGAGNLFVNDSLIKGNGWAHMITTSMGTFAAAWAGTSGTYSSSTAAFKAAGGGIPPTVALSWIPSTSPNLTGYNVYRGGTTGGPYTKINTSVIPSPLYTDAGVVAGSTYFYVATAVDYTGAESIYSNQATAAIPPAK